MTRMGVHGFEEMQGKRTQLGDLVARMRVLTTELEHEKWQQKLEALETRIRSDTFKILILGQFNVGKTTTINAMLGERVLPSYATPTTAVINEVKFGLQPYAVLHPLMSEEDRAQQPRTIDIADLEQFVVVDPEDEKKENPFERAEVYWPLDLCRTGVMIVDSPGLNEDPIREEITVRYLDEADAIVFVLNATQPLTDNERGFLEAFILPLGHEDIFFVFNKMNFVEEDQRDQVEAHARRKLSPFVKFDQRIFFVDAQGALKARLSNDAKRLEASNFPPVEASLEHFLTTQRGRVKILSPARELREALDAVRIDILERQGLLGSDLSELERRYDESKQPLALLQADVRRIRQIVESQNAIIVRDVQDRASDFLLALADRLPEMAGKAELTTHMTVNPLKVREQTAVMSQELIDAVGGQLHIEMGKWRAGEYKAMLTQRLGDLERRLSRDVDEFSAKLEAICVDITAIKKVTFDDTAVVPLPELVGIKGHLPSIGGGRGVTGLARVVIPAAALATTSIAIGFAPFVLVPVAALWAIGGDFAKHHDKTRARIRATVASQAADELRLHVKDYGHQVAHETQVVLDRMLDELTSQLTAQVEEVKTRVETVLAERDRGAAAVEAKRAQLAAIDVDVDRVRAELDTLIDIVSGVVRQAEPPRTAD